MTEKTIHFLSGLPRSGSTVISSILNQNPSVYVTPTSPMLNVAVKMQEAWATDPTVKANYNHLEPQINNLTKAMLPAFWEHRPEPIIIDKGRGWAKNMLNVNQLFGKQIKVLVITRNLPSIMASWLTIIKRQKNCFVDSQIVSMGQPVSDSNRLAIMWFNMVKDCMEGLKQIRQDVPDQILEIDYDDFVDRPLAHLLSIECFLGLPQWQYDLNNIVNDTIDDDLVAWGFDGLHSIRPVLANTAPNARYILGDEMYNHFIELEKQYI